MPRINLQALRIAVEKPLDRACRQVAKNIAEKRFEKTKKVFLEDFLTHPVSQEIDQGAKTGADDNLFSFIGFDINENPHPIEDLYEFLDKQIYLGKTINYDKLRGVYSFKVYAPTKNDIKEVTPMPWGTARSWVFAIESGISGLNHFLAARKRDLGRSTGGIQVKGMVLNAGAFKARKYMSELLNSLAKNLQR